MLIFLKSFFCLFDSYVFFFVLWRYFCVFSWFFLGICSSYREVLLWDFFFFVFCVLIWYFICCYVFSVLYSIWCILCGRGNEKGGIVEWRGRIGKWVDFNVILLFFECWRINMRCFLFINLGLVVYFCGWMFSWSWFKYYYLLKG